MANFCGSAGLALVAGLLAIGLALLPGCAKRSSVPADPGEILKKLTNRQFKSLDAELSSCEQQYEKDPARESPVMNAFAVFDTSKAIVGNRTAEWVKAEPGSYAAALAHADFLEATAGRWRGEGWASAVTPQQWQEAHFFYNQARAEAKRALSIDPHLAGAYAVLIDAAKVDGSRAELARVGTEALQHMPESYEVRESIMYSLMPRWGGSREAMVKFAEASQAYARENPAIASLKFWPTFDECQDLDDAKQWKAAAQCYTHALHEFGAHSTLYHRRALDYSKMRKFKLSLRDAKRAEARMFPLGSDNLELLAWDTEELNRPDASMRWISDYMKFYAPDAYMLGLMKAIQRKQFYKLIDGGVAAFKAGRFDEAERDAQKVLSDAPKFRKDWNYGNAIFKGNMIIGLVALKRDGSVARADGALLASAKQPGSPQLDSFGPNMSLAQALLERGQRSTVLEFLADCKSFWKIGDGRLDAWSKTIEAGGNPDFGPNLGYY